MTDLNTTNPTTAAVTLARDALTLAQRRLHGAWQILEAICSGDDYTRDRKAAADKAQRGWEEISNAIAAIDALPAAAPAVAAPEPRPLTGAQIERHSMPASECPPDSVVMLVSSIRYLLGMAAAPTAQEPE